MGDLDALARELVETGMPWLPGMLMWHGGDRLVLVDSSVPKKPAGYWASDHGVWYEATIEGAPDLTDWPTIGALLGELSRRLGPARRMRLAWRRDFDAVESPFRWIVEHGGTHEDSAMADRESCDNPGEAVGRALLAVLRAERVKP